MNKSPEEIIIKLKEKFDHNFSKWQEVENKELDKLIVSIFTLDAVGVLMSKRKLSVHHDICLKIFDEIIADTSSCIYLSACAIDKPASIVLRRVLELGVASVYLWDMPHIAYGWQKHDQDLSYTDMLKHISSESYVTYIQKQNNITTRPKIIDYKVCQKTYGDLSDIVHGKINSFETELTNRFTHDEEDWKRFINLAECVLSIIINANISRHSLKNDVEKYYARSVEVIK